MMGIDGEGEFIYNDRFTKPDDKSKFNYRHSCQACIIENSVVIKSGTSIRIAKVDSLCPGHFDLVKRQSTELF